MVKRKVVWWPEELILEKEVEIEYTVKLLNKTKTRITVTKRVHQAFHCRPQLDGWDEE
jgi:hypothetical protein